MDRWGISDGDWIAFPPRTGVGHTIINEADVEDLALLLVGTRVNTGQGAVRHKGRAGLEKEGSSRGGRWTDAQEREGQSRRN